MTRSGPPSSSGVGSSPPPTPHQGGGPNALIWRWWNVLLLLPFLMLITPWFNKDKPRLLGLPLFYWYQLAFVFVGVACVSIVYAATRTPPTGPLPPPVPAGPGDTAAGTDGIRS